FSAPSAAIEYCMMALAVELAATRSSLDACMSMEVGTFCGEPKGDPEISCRVTAADRECANACVRLTHIQISGSAVRCQNIVRGRAMQRRNVLPCSDRARRWIERKCVYAAFAQRNK